MAKNIERYFIISALIFAGIGFYLGLTMAMTNNHTQIPTHAHVMLIGWVFSALYGILYRLWPELKSGSLCIIHFVLHLGGLILMVPVLYMLTGGLAAPETIVPLAILSGVTVAAAWALFLFMFLTRTKN